MKTLLVFCFIIITHAVAFAGGNVPIARQVRASVGISLLQDEMKQLSDAVDSCATAVTPDWQKIDAAISKWFDDRKASGGNPVSNYFINNPTNTLIESTKTKARSDLATISSGWTTIVESAKKTLQIGINSFWNALPYGDVNGVYRYTEGQSDPGSPGWELDPNVVWVNLNSINGSVGTGLVEIEIKVAGDGDIIVAGVTGEVVTKISSDNSIDFNIKMRDAKPYPADPQSKPEAKTGFDAYMDATIKLSTKADVLIKISAMLQPSYTINLGKPTRNIIAGKFRKPSDP